MKKCDCGHKEKTIAAMNKHRRDCDTFWQSVYAEMRRIAMLLYQKPAPVSCKEWTDYRYPRFPGTTAMTTGMGKAWAEIQLNAGMGMGQHGSASTKIKGQPALSPLSPEKRSDNRLDLVALQMDIETMPPETYMASTSGEGLPICERSYRETGRMWIR